MPRWLRVIRGMIGTGLTFSMGVGVVASLIGGLVWLIPGALSARELLWLVARCSVIAFPVGVAFSGVLAITAHGRSFDKLSIPRFAALGAGAGFLLYMLMGVNGAFRAWSVANAIGNLVTLTLMGAGSATAILLFARRARPALKSADESHSLGE